MSFEHIFFPIFGLVALYLLYQVVKKRGFRGAMFGAPVAETVGEVDLGRHGMLRTRVKVHRPEPDDTASPQIGLELVMTTIGSFRTTPLRMTRDQARALSELLSQAAAAR